jgi:hypothetical protein
MSAKDCPYMASKGSSKYSFWLPIEFKYCVLSRLVKAREDTPTDRASNHIESRIP